MGEFIFESFLHNGTFGVTFFFLTSAFLVYRIYAEKDIKNPVAFLKKNVSKFYALYMTTHIAVAAYLMLNGASIPKTLIKLLLVATLMQSMTVTGATILNGACWFLSTLFVLYILSPFMIKFVKKLSQRQVYACSILMFVLLFAIHICVNALGNKEIISSQVATNLTYTFPPYWVPTYILGMLANRWFFLSHISKQRQNEYAGFTLLEIASVVVALAVYLFGINGPEWISGYRNITYVIVLLPIVVLFSREDGWISKWLAKSRLVKWATLTMEIYMIHYVVITCAQSVLNKVALTIAGGILAVVIVFGVTIAISVIWKGIYKKLYLVM